MAEPGDGSTKFARALASNSKAQRDAALDALARWLAAREVVEESDLLKVWKGMFYALWHADKAPVQVRSPSDASPRRPSRHGSVAERPRRAVPQPRLSLSLTRAALSRLTWLRRWQPCWTGCSQR